MRRNNIYLVLVLFLLTTNVATIIIVTSRKESTAKQYIPVSEQPRSARMNFMWDELGLTPEQVLEVTDYNNEYNNRAMSIAIELDNLREEIVREITADNPDNKRLDKIIDELGEKHVELKKETVDYYYKLRSVCDSSQRDRLEFLYRDMLNPEGVIYGRGRGGQGRGRQYMERGQGRGRQYMERGRGRGNGRAGFNQYN